MRKIETPLRRTYGPHRREQPRLARLRVGLDRHVVDRDGHLARLDDRLQRVGVLRDDLQLRARPRGCRRGSPTSCPAPWSRDAWRTTHEPEPLQRLLQRREVLDRHHLAVADDHVGVAGDDRLDELEDVRAVVLVVGVGVDDHVGTELQRGVEAGLEAVREALVVRQPDDVVDAVGARHLDGAVGRAVVDDEPLDGVEAGHLTGQVGERDGEVFSSFRHGIWMINFIRTDGRRYRARQTYRLAWRAQRSPGRAREPMVRGRDRARESAATASRSSSSRCCASASLIGFFVFPTYPVYDSYYSLLWGRDLLARRRAGLRRLPLPDPAPARDRRRRRAAVLRRVGGPAVGGADPGLASWCWSRASTGSARSPPRRSWARSRPRCC